MADAHYGILAEFKSPEALLEAARRVRAEGYRQLDAFTPFPVEGLPALLELHDRRVPLLGLIGGCVGCAAGLVMQIYISFDYPLNVGGRPLYPLSAFAVVTFELTILFAAAFAVTGMLAMNGLPRLSYPVFAARRFHLASRDRFFLCVRGGDPHFDADATRRFLEMLGPESVEVVIA
jgi:hypothetical protein